MLSENDPPKHQAIVAPLVNEHTENFTNKNVSNISSSAVAKSRSSSFKRVSFGTKGTVVETFIYESVPADERTWSYTPPPAPTTPTKLRVELVDSQVPSSIAPPAEVNLVSSGQDGKILGPAVASSSSSTHPSDHHHHHIGVLTTQPQLPSLRKMDDHENPFRPEGKLSHEVDPIVETYKTRPFVTSSSIDNDVVDQVAVASHASMQQQQHTLPAHRNSMDVTDSNATATTASKSSTKTNVPPAGGNNNSNSKKSGAKNGAPVKPTEIKLNINDGSTTTTVVRATPQTVDVKHEVLASPKAGHVEVVHLEEKRKRCACCVVQ